MDVALGWLGTHVLTVGMGIGGAVMALPSLLVGILHIVGFTPAGVAAGEHILAIAWSGSDTLAMYCMVFILSGSVAAWIQSVIYGGAAGGLFSILQSFGASATVIANPFLALGGFLLMVVGWLIGKWAAHAKSPSRHRLAPLSTKSLYLVRKDRHLLLDWIQCMYHILPSLISSHYSSDHLQFIHLFSICSYSLPSMDS